MGSKLPWSSGELDALVANPESKVVLVQSQIPVVLQPFHLQDLKSAVKGILDLQLDSYHKSLNGIVLSYKRLKILSTSGTVGAETSGVSVETQADFYVFRPEVGCTLKGVVNKISKDHVGVLLYKRFNVACPRPSRYVDTDSWLGSQVLMHQEVTFKLKDVNFSGRLPYFKGKLISCGDVLESSAHDELVNESKKKKEKVKEIEKDSDHEKSKAVSKKRLALDHHEETAGKSKKAKKNSEEAIITPEILTNLKSKSSEDKKETDIESSHHHVTPDLSLNTKAKKKKKSKEKTLETLPEEAVLQDHVKSSKGKKKIVDSMVDSVGQQSVLHEHTNSLKEKKKKNISVLHHTEEQSLTSAVLPVIGKLKKEKKKNADTSHAPEHQLTQELSDKKSKRLSKGIDEVDFIPKMALNESFFADSQLLDNLPPPNADSTHFDLGRTRLSLDPRAEKSKKKLTDIKEKSPVHQSQTVETNDKTKKNKKNKKRDESKASIPTTDSQAVISEKDLNLSPKKKKKLESSHAVPSITPGISVGSLDMLKEPPRKKKKTKDVVEEEKHPHEMGKLLQEESKKHGKNKKKKDITTDDREILSVAVAGLKKISSNQNEIVSSPKKKRKKTNKEKTQDPLGLETSGTQSKVQTGNKGFSKSSQELPAEDCDPKISGKPLSAVKTGTESDSDEEIPCGQRAVSPPPSPYKSPNISATKSPGFSYTPSNKMLNFGGRSSLSAMTTPVRFAESEDRLSPPNSPTFIAAGEGIESSSDSEPDVPRSPKKVVVSKRADTSSDSDSDAPAKNLKQSVPVLPVSLSLSKNRKAESSDSDSEDESKPVSKILQSMGVMQSPLKTVLPRKGGGTSSSDSDSSDEKYLKPFKLPSAPKSILKTAVKPSHASSGNSDSDDAIRTVLAKLPTMASKSPTKQAPKSLQKKASVPKTATKASTQKAPVKKPSKAQEPVQAAPFKSPSKTLPQMTNESSKHNVSWTTSDDADSDSDMETMKIALKSLNVPCASKINSPAKSSKKPGKKTANSPKKIAVSPASPSKSHGVSINEGAPKAPYTDSDGDSSLEHKSPKKQDVRKSLNSDSDSGPDDRNTTVMIQEHRKQQAAEQAAELAAENVAKKKSKPRTKTQIKVTDADTSAAEAARTAKAAKGTTKGGELQKNVSQKASKKSKAAGAHTVKDMKEEAKEKVVNKGNKKKQKKPGESSTDSEISDIMQRLLKQANMKLGLS